MYCLKRRHSLDFIRNLDEKRDRNTSNRLESQYAGKTESKVREKHSKNQLKIERDMREVVNIKTFNFVNFFESAPSFKALLVTVYRIRRHLLRINDLK